MKVLPQFKSKLSFYEKDYKYFVFISVSQFPVL